MIIDFFQFFISCAQLLDKAVIKVSDQRCSKTTKLQDQDHLIFQDQDRFLKTIKLLTQALKKQISQLCR